MTTRLVPRAERLDLSFPVIFRDSAALITGHCLNLSQSGLLATFARPLDIWTVGSVTLTAGPVAAVLLARVARVEEQQAGLAFLFANQGERDLVQQCLVLAKETTHLVGPPPF